MLDFFNHSSAIGLSFSGPFIKRVRAISHKGILHVEDVETLDCREIEGNVKRLDITEKQAAVVTCLRSGDVLVRPLEIKLTKKRDVRSVLPFQAEPLLPFPVEEAVLQHIEIGQTKKSTQLTVLAAKKELVGSHLSAMNELGVDPEIVSTSPAALAAFSQALNNASPKLPVLIIHCGMEETLCVLAEDGKLIADHSIKQGVSGLIRAIESDTGHAPEISEIDLSTIDSDAAPGLAQAVTALKQEVSRATFSLVKQHRGQNVSKVLLTGHGGPIKGIGTLFSEGLHVKVSVPEAQFGQTSEILQEYAIPIGLAFSFLAADEPDVNFRQGEYAYGDPWKRLKTPLYSYFGASVVLALSFFILGNVWSGSKLDNVKQKYASLLESLEKPYTPFERQYLKSNPFDEPADIENITPRQLAYRLDYLDNEIQRSPNTFNLFPDVPKVSDVLAWLATHNLVTDRESGKPLLNIKNFHYTLVKRPEAKNKNQKYSVKVELEFRTDVPMKAREFHDALIAPNDIVDPKGEVKWSTSGDIFRTSFFLKNRPPKQRAGNGGRV
jgi:type IV pilus assembly protein PilM